MSATGTRTELARYRVSAGERILHGQRILGVVRVTDAPARGKGRRYLLERELTSKAELDGLVSDYLDQADRWDDIPLLHLYPDNEVAR